MIFLKTKSFIIWISTAPRTRKTAQIIPSLPRSGGFPAPAPSGPCSCPRHKSARSPRGSPSARSSCSFSRKREPPLFGRPQMIPPSPSPLVLTRCMASESTFSAPLKLLFLHKASPKPELGGAYPALAPKHHPRLCVGSPGPANRVPVSTFSHRDIFRRPRPV